MPTVAPTTRIATRGSALAMAQAGQIAERLRREAGLTCELHIVKTRGDIRTDVPLSEIGGKGLFVREVEAALVDGRADIAVHSGKDVPIETHPALLVAAHPQRADVRDVLVSAQGGGLETIAQGASVGTGSLRRTALLRAMRPDLDIVPVRGNVDTRVGFVSEGRYAAVILAAAGLDRMGLADTVPHHRLSADDFVPAPAQGALAIQTRADADALVSAVSTLDDPDTRIAVEAERAFLRHLGADCHLPLAIYVKVDGERVRMDGLVASPDGLRMVRDQAEGLASDAVALALELGERVAQAGGRDILEALDRG